MLLPLLNYFKLNIKYSGIGRKAIFSYLFLQTANIGSKRIKRKEEKKRKDLGNEFGQCKVIALGRIE